ncbi:MAG: hypothetical protein ABJB76_11125 [Candidatus Nitrosocosmicus sp.]
MELYLIISVNKQCKMQRGYKILILSGILLLSSIIIFFIWGITFSGLFIANNHNFSTNQIMLPSLHSYNSSIYINSINKLLTFTIRSTNNDQIKFKEIVVGPEDNVVSNSTFQKTYFSTIKPNTTGEYKMTIINTDKSINNTSLHIFFGILPFLKDNGELDMSSFIGLIGGLISFTTGLVSLSIGTIFLIKDRYKQNYRNYIPR